MGAPVTVFSDNFDAETGTNLENYTGFANWNVTSGSVDIFDNGGFGGLSCSGGAGKCVDMDGSSGAAGTLVSKQSFALGPGTYELTFALSGNQRGQLPVPGATDPDTLTVSVGGLASSPYTLAPATTFGLYTLAFSVSSLTSAPITFAHAGNDNLGIILDDITLTQLTAVPVPAAALLFLSAFGFIPALRRRA
jgi:hypothetical protein